MIVACACLSGSELFFSSCRACNECGAARRKPVVITKHYGKYEMSAHAHTLDPVFAPMLDAHMTLVAVVSCLWADCRDQHSPLRRRPVEQNRYDVHVASVLG